MKQRIIQQQEYKLNKENPLKSISFLDLSDESNNEINGYTNKRIPMALIGNVSIREIEFTIEYEDLLFDAKEIKENETTTLFEISIKLAPTEEILNLYRSGRNFKGTITKDNTLYTKYNAFVITTPYAEKSINTGKNDCYYGHIYEYKKKNPLTNKSSNLGYDFTFYINPNEYEFKDAIFMVKELLGLL